MAARRKAAKGVMKAARAMPGKRSTARGGAKLGARAAKRNAYLQTVLHDDRVHERVRTGIGSARAAYGRVSRRGKGAEDLLADRKARRNLGQALVAFQEAAAVIRGAKVRQRRKIGTRVVLPVAVAGGVAVTLNEGLRQRLLGLVSGSSNGSGPQADSSAPLSPSGRAAEPSAPVENAPPTVREDA